MFGNRFVQNATLKKLLPIIKRSVATSKKSGGNVTAEVEARGAKSKGINSNIIPRMCEECYLTQYFRYSTICFYLFYVTYFLFFGYLIILSFIFIYLIYNDGVDDKSCFHIYSIQGDSLRMGNP